MPKQRKLVILDDTFPFLMSGFRIAEYNYLLSTYKNSKVYTTFRINEHIEKYKKVYPDLYKKICFFDPTQTNIIDDKLDKGHSLFFIMFLHNAYSFLPIINFYKIPFILEMYAGGFFSINDAKSDKMLNAICKSPYLHTIFVNFSMTQNYIVEKYPNIADKVSLVSGCITQVEYWEKNMKEKIFYKKGKQTFDICFIAHRYMPRGENKGYDVFVEIAKKICSKINNCFFHVVGGHTADDIDITEIKDKIFFYGIQSQEFFSEFYADKDIVLFLEYPPAGSAAGCSTGGFPSVSAVQSAINGVAIFAKDYSNQNDGLFTDKKDIVFLDGNIRNIEKEICYYYENVEKLYVIAKNGQSLCKKIYSEKFQMNFRTAVINEILNDK